MTFKEKRKYAFEHPVKSGNLIGEIFATVIMAIALGIVLYDSVLKGLFWGYSLSGCLLFLIIANSYYGIYKSVKWLETMFYDPKSRGSDEEEVV